MKVTQVLRTPILGGVARAALVLTILFQVEYPAWAQTYNGFEGRENNHEYSLLAAAEESPRRSLAGIPDLNGISHLLLQRSKKLCPANALFVATNGTPGATGTINDPLDSLASARDSIRRMKSADATMMMVRMLRIILPE